MFQFQSLSALWSLAVDVLMKTTAMIRVVYTSCYIFEKQQKTRKVKKMFLYQCVGIRNIPFDWLQIGTFVPGPLSSLLTATYGVCSFFLGIFCLSWTKQTIIKVGKSTKNRDNLTPQNTIRNVDDLDLNSYLKSNPMIIGWKKLLLSKFYATFFRKTRVRIFPGFYLYQVQLFIVAGHIFVTVFMVETICHKKAVVFIFTAFHFIEL